MTVELIRKYIYVYWKTGNKKRITVAEENRNGNISTKWKDMKKKKPLIK